MLPWDDPGADPGQFDLCVLRSCWDYHRRPREFLDWIARAARLSRLYNSEAVVRWNIHKRYLGELERAAVPIIPTMWFAQGETPDLPGLLGESGWRDVVVKPAVSAASYKTKKFGGDSSGEAGKFLNDLLAERDAMVQRYMPSVEAEGEKAVVMIDGIITHAVRKSPRYAGDAESVSEGMGVTEEEIALASAAIGVACGPLLYGRVDLVRDESGKLVVSELELMEPSLFLLQHPPALDRLAGAIGRLCGTR